MNHYPSTKKFPRLDTPKELSCAHVAPIYLAELAVARQDVFLVMQNIYILKIFVSIHPNAFKSLQTKRNGTQECSGSDLGSKSALGCYIRRDGFPEISILWGHLVDCGPRCNVGAPRLTFCRLYKIYRNIRNPK